MEWSKIEQEWKKKVEERTITPSTAAWDKLAKQLDGEEKKIKKLAYRKWMAIAACLLVTGIAGVVMMQLDPVRTIEHDSIHFSTDERQVVVEEQATPAIQKEVVEQGDPVKVDHVKTPVFSVSTLVENQVLVQQLNPKPLEIQLPVGTKTEQVDSLLMDELRIQKTPTRVVVNSNNLLDQVEGEIEIEYRDTKMKKMIDSAKKLVVDISNINYEEQN